MDLNDSERQAQNILWLTRALAAAACVAMIVYLLIYLRERSWQVLTITSAFGLTLLCLMAAIPTTKKKHFRQAGCWLVAAVLIMYSAAALLTEGAVLQINIMVTLLLIMVRNATTPEKWKGWAVLLSVTIIAGWLIDQAPPFPRFNLEGTPIDHLSLMLTGFVILLMQWQMLHLGGQVRVLGKTVDELQEGDTLLQRQLKELTILHAVALASAEIHDEDVLLERVTQIIGEALYPDSFGILLLDRQTGKLHLHPSYRLRPQAIRFEEIALEEGITGMVAADGIPRLILDVNREPNYKTGDPELRSELCVPIKIEGDIIGVVNAECTHTNGFNEADKRLLITLAGQLATAIDRLRRTDEIRHKAQQLATVYDVGQQITAILDMDQLLSRIGRLVFETLDVQNVEISLIKGDQLFFYAGCGGYIEPGFKPNSTMKVGEGITGKVAATGEPILAPDVLASPDYFHYHLLPNVGAELAVPLKVNEKTIGVLDIKREVPYTLNEDDLAFLETLAAQVAIAIQNAELYEAAQRQLDELKVLHAIATVGAEASDEDTIIEHATQLIGETFYPDHFGVLLLDENEVALHYHPAYRGLKNIKKPEAIPLGKGITGSTVRDGRTRRIANVGLEPAFIPTTKNIQSELCVPIQTGEKIIGVINAESARLDAFTEGDERLLLTFAGQLGTAIEKARLFQQLQDHADELKKALTRQKELDQLKSDFIRNTSHELGTPMAIIRGHLELLEAGELGNLSPLQQRSVTIAARRTRMLSNMLKDLVALLTAEARQRHQEPVELTSLVQDIITDMQLTMKQKGLTLQAEITADTAVVVGDPQHLERVLDNLLSNARKFTPEGGRITVKLTKEADRAVLSVSDTGIGIPENKLDRIFERFYQVDGGSTRRYGGTGLGLALVKEVVEAHGGEVTVTSTPGKGSTFRVTLPLFS